MNNEIKINPTSNVTATMTTITLSETPKTKMQFKPMQVDNKNDSQKRIKGKLIFMKENSKNTKFDLKKLSRRDIKYNEYVELQLNTEETYKLAKGLYEYFSITAGKSTPFEPQTYIKKSDNINQIQQNLEGASIKDVIPALIKLSSNDFKNIETSTNIAGLKKACEIIENNIEVNCNESFWQKYFSDNAAILSQVFATPYVYFKE